MEDVGLRPVCAQPRTALAAWSTHVEKGGLLRVHQRHGWAVGGVDGLDEGLGRAMWG